MPTTAPEEGLYRDIVEQSPDAVIATDAEGQLLIWNRAAEALFGFTREEIARNGIDLIIPENLRNAHWEGFRRAVAAAQTKHSGKAMTTRSLTKRGDTIYVDMSFSLIKSTDGRVAGTLAIAREVTQNHQANKALKARLAELEGAAKKATGS